MQQSKNTLKIIIVEDDPDDQFMIKRIFNSLFPDVSIHLVSNGDACIKYLDANSSSLPDLITMDLNMPLMNGFETTAYIKKDSRFSHVPVVMLSTSDREVDMKASVESGANDYFIKNIDYGDLKNTIKDIVEKWLK
jgi:CheY-like chemotaxis protein